MYRWASPYQDEWETAMRELEACHRNCGRDGMPDVGLGVRARGIPDRSLNDRGGLHRPETCEGQFFRAMDILVPILEREG